MFERVGEAPSDRRRQHLPESAKRKKYLFCQAKSMSSIFEDAAFESIVFVVPERWSARNVLDLSSGMAKVLPNHCIRSVWECPSAENITCVAPTVLSNIVDR